MDVKAWFLGSQFNTPPPKKNILTNNLQVLPPCSLNTKNGFVNHNTELRVANHGLGDSWRFGSGTDKVWSRKGAQKGYDAILRVVFCLDHLSLQED